MSTKPKRLIEFVCGAMIVARRLHLVWGRSNATFVGAFRRRGELIEFWFGPLRAMLWR